MVDINWLQDDVTLKGKYGQVALPFGATYVCQHCKEFLAVCNQEMGWEDKLPKFIVNIGIEAIKDRGYCKYCKRDITEEITTVRNWDRIAVLVAYHM
jgi:hypothetical protein